MEYFLLSGLNSPKVASAFAPDRTILAHEMIDKVYNLTEVPFTFSLKQLSVKENKLVVSDSMDSDCEIWRDYLPNSLAWPFFSTRLKGIFDRLLTGNEGLSWIKVKISNGSDFREYYIPKFSSELDTIDNEKSLFAKGTGRLIKPVFSSNKVSRFSVFHGPSENRFWRITSALYVNKVLKTAIQTCEITGIQFEKTRVT